MFNTSFKLKMLIWGLGALSLGLWVVVLTVETPRSRLVGAFCDRAVEAALTTTDLVEFERSALIARKLNCSFRRRILAHSATTTAVPPPLAH